MPTRKNKMKTTRKKTARRTTRTAVARALTSTQKVAVTNIVKRRAETKYVTNSLRVNTTAGSDLGTWTGFTSGITGVGEIYPAIAITQQGVGDYLRIGDYISPQSVKVTLDLAVDTAAADGAYDRTVHIFLLTSKSVKSLDNYTAIPIVKLMDTGSNSGGVSFDGTPFRAQLRVNKKEFNVLKYKTIRLVKGIGQITGASTATDGTLSPARSYARVRMNVKCPEEFKYENGNTKYPTNYAPFIVIGWVDNVANNAASSVGSGIQVLGQVAMSYKDT